ncbi:MAG TPA: FCD domain-containing protein [Jatrophihabitantaceae bacterium]|nr:FCD domain-containing protein [Jatrophihabitantaceae bacterium]
MDPRFGEPPSLRRSDWDTSRAQRLHQSQAGRAAQHLTEIAQAAEPGTRLGSKDELRARCGVSVGTFNEAVRLVQARGVVWIRPGPGGGLFAATQSPMTRLGNSVLAMETAGAPVAEAIRIRAALEPLLLEDALWHASPADIAALREYLAEMEPAVSAGDRATFAAAKWRLHHYLASLTPNAMLRSLCTNLFDLIEAEHSEEPANSDLAETYRTHCALVDAIDTRDRTRAMRLISVLAGERAARPD